MTTVLDRPADRAERARVERCPRCEGRMFLEDDIDGPEYTCLQCGHRKSAGPRPGLALTLPLRRERIA